MEISKQGNAWTVRIPGAKEGEDVEIQDANGVGRHIKLGEASGDSHKFTWANARMPEPDGRFIKQNGEWIIQTDAPHKPGDKVLLSTQKGIQEHVLGESAGEKLFRPEQKNHFVRNPTGDNPKWCVQVYESCKSGDIVDVVRRGGLSQKHTLVSEVKEGIWTTKRA